MGAIHFPDRIEEKIKDRTGDDEYPYEVVERLLEDTNEGFGPEEKSEIKSIAEDVVEEYRQRHR